tara:strand:- start:882 stop:1700 length:819 start_codon:yes stop_codon:yes gene_type:complete
MNINFITNILNNICFALNDLTKSIKLKHIWYNLAISEIKSSYKRTKLGPIWITLSTLALLGAMGPLYSKIFGAKLEDYFLYLACGFIFWDFTRSSIVEMGSAYVNNRDILLSNNFPYSLYLLKTLFKNLITLFHNFFIVILAIFIINKTFGIIQITFFIGLILSSLLILNFLLIISIICTRYRDIVQIINSIMTVMFFLTPIIWHTDLLKDRLVFIYGNPFFLIIDSMRSPLIYNEFPIYTNLLIALILIASLPFTLYFFGKYKSKIPFWTS